MGAPISQITLDVLRHLHVNGLRTRAEIVKALKNVPPSTIHNLWACGHVAIDKTDKKEVRYYITPRGLAKLRNPNGRPKSVAALADETPDNGYVPTEYRPSPREGAMVAYILPSRVGNRLRWPPDGRETDLHCNPL